jgi:pilus assembly protein CpaE
MLARISSTVLRKDGYQVQTANDGPSALEAAEMWRPDLILLDVMMPGMDGYEVCRLLRQTEAHAHTPIIMLTARSSIEDKTRGYEVGADDYITKPYENAELLLRVKALLRRGVTPGGPGTGEPGKVIAVFSLRGGSGCSSLAVNMAVGLSQLWQLPVPLIDFSTPVGSCDLLLNLRPRNNLDGLVEQDPANLDSDLIQEYLEPHDSGVLLLGGITNPVNAEMIKPGHVSAIIEGLVKDHPYLVFDVPHNFLGPSLGVLDVADKIVMPITPDISSVRVTATALRVFDQLGFDRERIELVLNWTFSGGGLEARRIEKSLNHPIHCTFEHDPIWNNAINLGKPIVVREDRSATIETMENLIWDLSREEDRERVPDEPTAFWKRTRKRARQRAEAAASWTPGDLSAETKGEKDQVPAGRMEAAALPSEAEEKAASKKSVPRRKLRLSRPVLFGIGLGGGVVITAAVVFFLMGGKLPFGGDRSSPPASTPEEPAITELVPLSDNFSDPSLGLWPVQDQPVSLGYELGGYRITNELPAPYLALLNMPGEYGAVIVEATLTQLEANEDTAAGLVFRYRDPSNYYVFAINGAGAASLWAVEGGVPRNLSEGWVESDAISIGVRANLLTIAASGPRMTGVVNGAIIIDVTDEAEATTGSVGIYTSASQTQVIDVIVDDFKLQPQD